MKANDLKNMKKRVDETEKQAKDLLTQAETLAKVIPGTKDDEIVQSIKKQVDSVTEQYGKLKETLSGVTGESTKKSQ